MSKTFVIHIKVDDQHAARMSELVHLDEYDGMMSIIAQAVEDRLTRGAEVEVTLAYDESQDPNSRG